MGMRTPSAGDPPDREPTLTPMGGVEAAAVARWRYPPPYDFYDGSEAEIAEMLDPANGYRAVRVEGEFVGFLCAGPDARVEGQVGVAGIEDIGWGFRPDLVGRGLASGWAVAAVETLSAFTSAQRQRVVIATWNGRSLAVARRLGFAEPTAHVNATGHWTILTRSLRRPPRH